MRFDPEKKKAIVTYLLEKIAAGTDSLSKTVSETLRVSPNTINTYLRELMEQKLITKQKRGAYALVKKEYRYHLRRSKGHLDTDTYAFDTCLRQHISSFGRNVQEIWAYTFSEMINNVVDHSQAEDLFITVEQDILNTSVSIYDNGVGIFQKIKDHFRLPSLEEAICELFKGKLTTDSANHSGEGIFFSSKMMDSFFILSGKKVFTNNKYDNDQMFDLPSDDGKGTCVIMSLSNFSHKQSREVFDAYSNVDGGFIRTKIPLKNIFDASPVSRSQAKRICNRLERFREVVLDFEGIDWMGQGFAHQIFVIFKREHPDICLITEHMSEAVEKMYYHVVNGEQ